MTLKAIQTAYKGYNFRSRTEARYAIFLDALGLRWEYEKEGFDLGPAGWYLPDFWLTDLDCWIEIKPTGEGSEDGPYFALAAASGKKLYLFYGPVPGHEHTDKDHNYESAEVFEPEGAWDNFYAFCVCPDCGQIGIEFDGRSDRLPCKECLRCANHRVGFSRGVGPGACWDKCQAKCRRRGSNLDKGHTHDYPRLVGAVYAARSARFEHGQSGPTYPTRKVRPKQSPPT